MIKTGVNLLFYLSYLCWTPAYVKRLVHIGKTLLSRAFRRLNCCRTPFKLVADMKEQFKALAAVAAKYAK